MNVRDALVLSGQTDVHSVLFSKTLSEHSRFCVWKDYTHK